MSFKAIEVFELINYIYHNWGDIPTYHLHKRTSLSSEDTYLVIFGKFQQKEQEYFLKHFKGKILHISKKAVNKTSGHGTTPRNTLVVFEVDQPNAPWGNMVKPDEEHS